MCGVDESDHPQCKEKMGHQENFIASLADGPHGCDAQYGECGSGQEPALNPAVEDCSIIAYNQAKRSR